MSGFDRHQVRGNRPGRPARRTGVVTTIGRAPVAVRRSSCLNALVMRSIWAVVRPQCPAASRQPATAAPTSRMIARAFACASPNADAPDNAVSTDASSALQ